MNLKFIDKIEIVTFYNNLTDEDENVVSELACLTFKINKKIVEVLDSFLSFLKKR
jgi:hypothetical protein